MTKIKTKIMIHMKMKMLMMMKMMVMTERLPFSTCMSCQQHMKPCVLRAGSQHTCRIQDQELNVVLQVCCLMFGRSGKDFERCLSSFREGSLNSFGCQGSS